MPIDFYTNPMSRGQIARWMLEEVGADYTEHLLDYRTSMKAPDYLAINPMGKVPAIVHDGQAVTEGAAICAYLADVFPAAGLAPQPDERAAYHRWMFFAAGPMEQGITAQALGWKPTTDQQRTAGFGSYDRMVDVVEARLEESPYFAGDRFTAADVYAGSQVDWGLLFKTLPSRPAFEGYAARLRERPAYRKAKARDQQLIAAAQS